MFHGEERGSVLATAPLRRSEDSLWDSAHTFPVAITTMWKFSPSLTAALPFSTHCPSPLSQPLATTPLLSSFDHLE